jgi:hypothetical protein
LSLTEIDKRPHQATAAGAGEKRTGKIESPTLCPMLSRIPAITRKPATMAIGR